MMKLGGLFLTLLVAGCLTGYGAGYGAARERYDHPAPAIPAPELLACPLPPPPMPAVIVGYPDASTIYVTKADLAEITRELAGDRAWIEAASTCLGGRQ